MITSIENRVVQITERLLSKHIKVDTEWISGCVEWFLSDIPTISNNELFEKAYEQWRLADLSEAGAPSLPVSVEQNTNPFTLTGSYAVQMEYLMDISESPYDQLRRLYNHKLDEAEEEENQRKQQTKKKRILKLYFTDGHRTVVGIEYSPIPSLSTKLLPGCKMLLIGPIRCANKVLFLESKHINILGGEVEKYQIENAFENVLLKALGRPLNLNPKTEYGETVVLEKSENNALCPANAIIEPHTVRESHPPMHSSNDIFDDDDLLLNINIEQIEQNHKNAIEVNANKHTSPVAHNSFNFDDDDEDLILIETPNEYKRIVSKPAECELKQKPIIENQIQRKHLDYDSDNDIDMLQIEDEIQKELQMAERCFEMEDEQQQQPSSTTEGDNVAICKPNFLDDNYNFQISGCSFVTIDELLSVDTDDLKEKCFVVKAEIGRIVEKLHIKNLQWCIIVDLNDGSEKMLKTTMTDEVLTNIVGLSARELHIMRSQIREKPHVKGEIDETLLMMRENLENLLSFMKIDFSDPYNPIVVQLIEQTDEVNIKVKQKLFK